MIKVCNKCGDEYDIAARRGQPGKISECEDCATEVAVKFTGNMIYSDKTAPQLQINTNPELTSYIINATKLKNKGSNLGSNLKVSSAMAKSSGACFKPLKDVSRRRDPIK